MDTFPHRLIDFTPHWFKMTRSRQDNLKISFNLNQKVTHFLKTVTD